MPTTASDVVSEEAVRSVLEEQTRKTYQFRRAFRDHDATDISDDSFSFPVSDEDFDGEVVEIGEGSDYPRTSKDYSKVRVFYDKRGFEFTITDEAVSDSRVPVAMNQEEDAAWAWQSNQDYLAFQILNNNLNSQGPVGDTDDTIQYADIVDARTTLFGDEYDLGEMLLFVGADGMGDLLKMPEFTQASEMGDMVIETGLLPNGEIGEGFLGEAGGIPTYATNTGDLGPGEAILVDQSQYGYESTRWEREINQYRDDKKDQDVWKVRSRGGYVSTDASAAIKIDS